MVKQHKSAQAGFTLVELAIVMIIIGLLITGVLKGQQLITNAQITSTVAQIKAIDAATTSFRDQYNATPGDMLTPNARIANCPAAGACGLPGNGDGRVGTASILFTAVPATEQISYWAQLNSAGLLTGINPDPTGVTATAWGQYAPASKVSGGGLDVGWYAGGVTLGGLQNVTATIPAPAGTYLAVHGTAGARVAGAAADSFLTPNLAARIDTKLDDSQPNTGTVLAAGAAAASGTSCASAATAVGVYNEAVTNAVCSIYIQFQN
jgi:prepilin-type N-terminal cleavage/methylation domain-containing protein